MMKLNEKNKNKNKIYMIKTKKKIIQMYHLKMKKIMKNH